jgi:phage tail sheath gpL-like
MAINDNSLAPALGVSGKNVAQTVSAQVLKRKILMIGTYDPSITSVVNEVPKRVFSPEDVGAQTGFGFMLHRMAVQAFKGAPSVEIYIQPQSEAGGGAQSTGTILYTAAPGVNGTHYLYIAGISVPVNLLAADTTDDVATKVVAAINADKLLPITAAVNGVTTNQVDITAKSAGEFWGDNITIDTNLYSENELGAIAYTITPMATGAGTPDITTALDALGTGSAQNNDNYTDVVHGYGAVTAVLDKIQTYNGIADDKVGNFDDLVHKPFRSVNGDVQAGSGGLSALIALGNGRKATDRTSGIIPVPGSASHPVEIGCLAMGYMATNNNTLAERSYKGQILDGIHPGVMADRWTNDYSTGRDAAAQAGISCTKVDGNTVKMQNALTFYHPDSIPQNSNAYRNMRNISLIQNIFNAVTVEFSQERWQQFSIVTDLAKVSNPASRTHAKSTSSAIDTWIKLFKAFSGNAWIADEKYSINKLKEAGAVLVRTGGNGFDVKPKFILSGDGDIIDNDIEYDPSFAILNQ